MVLKVVLLTPVPLDFLTHVTQMPQKQKTQDEANKSRAGGAEHSLTPCHWHLTCLSRADFSNPGCLPTLKPARQAGGQPQSFRECNYACLPLASSVQAGHTSLWDNVTLYGGCCTVDIVRWTSYGGHCTMTFKQSCQGHLFFSGTHATVH